MAFELLTHVPNTMFGLGFCMCELRCKQIIKSEISHLESAIFSFHHSLFIFHQPELPRAIVLLRMRIRRTADTLGCYP